MLAKWTFFCQVCCLWMGMYVSAADQQSAIPIEENALRTQVSQLIESHKIAGVGIGVIQKGKLVWAGYYGESSPGKPITDTTMFNTASIAKTVTAEVVLRLAARGVVELDASIADIWTHPDLGKDPQYRLLTPRLILSHQSGLLNWPYEYPDHKLAFIAKPGTQFSYSGAAYEILAKVIQAKTGKSYEDLVKSVVFDPLGMKGAAVSRAAWMEPRVAMPMDRQGLYQKPFAYPESGWEKPRGVWSAADDLYITVKDYSTFLISVMKNDAMTNSLAKKRHQIEASVADKPYWACILQDPSMCPDPFGYGLGWTVFQYGERTLVQHGGTDFGEHAFVYFDPVSLDGMVVFINGGNGWPVSAAIIDLLDPTQILGAHFKALIAKYMAK